MAVLILIGIGAADSETGTRISVKRASVLARVILNLEVRPSILDDTLAVSHQFPVVRGVSSVGFLELANRERRVHVTVSEDRYTGTVLSGFFGQQKQLRLGQEFIFAPGVQRYPLAFASLK